MLTTRADSRAALDLLLRARDAEALLAGADSALDGLQLVGEKDRVPLLVGGDAADAISNWSRRIMTSGKASVPTA